MIRATTRPRRSGDARSAANGIMIWPATDDAPTTTDPTSKSQNDGATAQTTSDTAAMAKTTATSDRRGCRSPSGTTSSSPAA